MSEQQVPVLAIADVVNPALLAEIANDDPEPQEERPPVDLKSIQFDRFFDIAIVLTGSPFLAWLREACVNKLLEIPGVNDQPPNLFRCFRHLGTPDGRDGEQLDANLYLLLAEPLARSADALQRLRRR